MRRTIFTMAMLAACSVWDPHGLGTDADAGSSSGEFMPDEKRPTPADTTSESASSSGAEIESDGSTSSSESDDTSSSSESSTGADEPSSPPYSGCDDPRCGLSPKDICFVSGDQWCTWACETVADCGDPPDGVTVVCVPMGNDMNGCRLACEGSSARS